MDTEHVSIGMSCGYSEERVCAACRKSPSGVGFLVMRKGEFTPTEIKYDVCYPCAWDAVLRMINEGSP